MKMKLLLMGCVLGLVAGCKVAVILVEGGEVQSTASGTCMIGTLGEGKVCIHEVSSTSYSESFTAVPDAGWHFVKWNSGGGFVCADAIHPTCVVSNLLLAGNPIGEAVVASEQTFYIMPVFAKSGTQITDTITYGGKEWAQVNLFTGLSWEQVNTVCPGGPCAEGGMLNDLSMTGWKWATLEEVGDLFALFTPHPGGIDEFNLPPIGDARQLYTPFAPTGTVYCTNGVSRCGQVLNGYTSGPTNNSSNPLAAIWYVDLLPVEGFGRASTLGQGPGYIPLMSDVSPGGWFYRTP